MRRPIYAAPALGGLLFVAVVVAGGLSDARAQAVLLQDPPPAAAASPFVALDGDAPLASSLVEHTLSDAEGRRIGDIEDLALGPSGSVKAVIVAVGTPGSGLRHVALDPARVSWTREGDGTWRATAAVTPDELRAAPTVAYKSGWNE